MNTGSLLWRLRGGALGDIVWTLGVFPREEDTLGGAI